MLYKLVCLDKEKFTSLTRNLQKKKHMEYLKEKKGGIRLPILFTTWC